MRCWEGPGHSLDAFRRWCWPDFLTAGMGAKKKEESGNDFWPGSGESDSAITEMERLQGQVWGSR